MNPKTIGIAAIALLLATMSGCIAVGGTDNITKPTLGRQLIDLQTARDSGAISEPEYTEAKASLLARHSVALR